MKRLWVFIGGVSVGLLTVIACAQAVASRERVEFIPNFREVLVHYATIERPDGKLHDLLISREALESFEETGIVPDGTVLGIESFSVEQNDSGEYLRDEQGRFIKAFSDGEVHFTEKRADWLENSELTTPSELTPGSSWRVGAFNIETGEIASDQNLLECVECHASSEENTRDFMFSWGRLEAFITSGEVNYFRCPTPGRESCFAR
jgi:hypothetical protein